MLLRQIQKFYRALQDWVALKVIIQPLDAVTNLVSRARKAVDHVTAILGRIGQQHSQYVLTDIAEYRRNTSPGRPHGSVVGFEVVEIEIEKVQSVNDNPADAAILFRQ